jgi:GT2 family glycosyltransferase
MNIPRVTVAIFNFHGKGQLDKCLAALASQDFAGWELILIDNSPDDGLLQTLKPTQPLSFWLEEGKAKLVTNNRNAGFARAANHAIFLAQGEFILLLNQDVFMEPGYIGALVAAMDADAQVASVTGKLLRPHIPGKPDVIDSAGHQFYDDRVVVNRGKDEEDKGQYGEGEVFGVSAAAAMYRLSALREIVFDGEIFDEDFFAYLEDIDIDFRLRRAGYKAWYTPSAVARHALAGSGGRRSFAIRFKAHTNRYKVIMKNDSFPLLMRDFLPMLRQETLQFLRTLFTSPLLFGSFFILPFKLPRLCRQRGFIRKSSKVPFGEIYNKWITHNRLS